MGDGQRPSTQASRDRRSRTFPEYTTLLRVDLKQAAHTQRPAMYLFGARPRGVSVLIRGPGCTQWAPRICPPVRAEPFVPRAQQTPAAQLHASHQLHVPCFPRPSSALGRPGLPACTLLCGVDLPQSPDLGPPLLGWPRGCQRSGLE